MIRANFKKKILPIAVLSTMAFGSLVGTFNAEAKNEGKENRAEIKNVIFLVGDGMGVSYTSAYRYLKDNPNTTEAEKTEFDKYLVGNQMTYPEDAEQNVTDSASAATAMSAGIKTYNNAIAVDNDGSEVKTVLEAAKENGKATGLVATSEITHATPASFGAHDETRKNMNGIADDYFDENLKIDFLIMDAEGYEPKILDGMKNILENNLTMQILTEYNPHTLQIAKTSGQKFLEKLEEFGFSIQVIDIDGQPQNYIKDDILKIKFPNTATLFLTKP